ncbi:MULTISPECIES: cytochrome P450 [Propionibacterium]|uniref:Cytochrome P450 109 n=1 Tax=Propionibacterium freudenreichii TaxID=1744 RepID=A0A2C8AQW3_9ACTN|nr:cytochrome P450 [Propionibacterium freudenreichii]MDN5985324.1 cytochrome P450 [Propionibacterium sp.]MCT2984464.1 cytochrome P450 [Propionibacterium freudenreichii]MCT2991824.1 cytochrome P450 [Propionibacterium freudenreichii]MCT2993907.1 cytochrome P450 [Propionibacterium freudenreichii]MCT2996116.1 cytochrome P450 [Propionibacterium freudenreichii]
MTSDTPSRDNPAPHEPQSYEWDPRAPEVLDNQIAAYDALRARCPVAHSEQMGWSLLRHDDVLRAATQTRTFSAVVSKHVAVPNGMDPPEHTVYRTIVDRYFTQEVVDAFEPACRAIAADLIAALPRDKPADIVNDLAEPFALQVQSAYLGWPERLREPLREWTLSNRRATASGDRAATAAVAEQFDGYITGLLDERRAMGDAAPDDLTTRLMKEQVDGRVLDDGELVSILRNWTVGELSTISAAAGIVVDHLAEHPDVQSLMRAKAGSPATLDDAVDEILRIHPPLISNRRVVAEPTQIGGRQFEPGERLTILWASANRDEDVFGDPNEFRLDRPREDNLLYGAGIHACPGAPLARLELRMLTQELLAATGTITPDRGATSQYASYPASGFAELSVILGSVTEG